jgi:predicted transposase YbfD/YdcC
MAGFHRRGRPAVNGESKGAPALLGRLPLEGLRVMADALHTQSQTARIITPERGADYLLTVKGNQPGVTDDVRLLLPHLTSALSPSRPGEPRSGG